MVKNLSWLVHENEAQRRHARVKLPAKLHLESGGQAYILEILDLSVSGFSVQVPRGLLQPTGYHEGELHFQVNQVAFRLPIKFMVVHCRNKKCTAGCTFDELGQDEISLLHLFIAKFISGELVANADVIATLSRENFTRPRENSRAAALGGWKKIRAIVGTGAAACISFLAVGFIAVNLYHHYFFTRAAFAMVDVEKEIIEAPASGYVGLISTLEEAVEKGKTVAEISSPAMEYIDAAAMKLGNDELQALLPQQFNSVVKSPCQGTIIQNQAKDQDYVKKGEPLFSVMRTEEVPYVRAIFNYEDADEVPVGKTVRLLFPGTAEELPGVVENVRIDVESRSSQLVAIIRPEEDLSYRRLYEPVNVEVSSASSAKSLVSSSLQRLSSLKSALAGTN